MYSVLLIRIFIVTLNESPLINDILGLNYLMN